MHERQEEEAGNCKCMHRVSDINKYGDDSVNFCVVPASLSAACMDASWPSSADLAHIASTLAFISDVMPKYNCSQL